MTDTPPPLREVVRREAIASTIVNRRYVSGPLCAICGKALINVEHDPPEYRAAVNREVYHYDYYATGAIDGGPIRYHEYQAP